MTSAAGFVPFILLLGALTASPWPSATASPRSTQLVNAGSDALHAGRPADAAGLFESATRDDPDDSDAWFFAGLTYNRLGRPDAALEALDRAQSLRSPQGDLPFERGWALLSLKRWDEAIEALEAYERTSPGRGQTSEFLGRAYLAKRQYPQAEAHLNEALRRDPDLSPTVSVYQALLEQRRGNELAAGQQLSTLLRTAPDSITGRFIGSQLQPIERVSGSRWWLGGSFGGGYNSDARGIPDLFPAVNRAPSSNDDSGFYRTEIDAGAVLFDRPDRRLFVGYDLLAEFFAEQQHDPDFLDQTLFLTYGHRFHDSLAASLRLWDNHTFLGEEELRNQAGGEVSLRLGLTDDLFIDSAYTYSNSDYLYRTRPVLDRDADTHALRLALEYAVPRSSLLLRGGYIHTWNFADGSDFAFDSDTLFAGIGFDLPWRVRADLFYLHAFEHYAFQNSASDDDERRDDDIDSLRLRLTRPISRHFGVYFQYDLTDDDSDVSGYGYEQHVVSAGLTWTL